MDLKMEVEKITDAGISWDCAVEDGIVPIISDGEEDLQTATLAGFIVKGTVPQLPDAGVPWTDFLTGSMTFGELDFYVRDSLRNVEKENFYPEYDIVEDKLTMSIGQIQQEEYNELSD